MFEKNEILLIIIVLLLAFYFVISFGASIGVKSSKNTHIARYLFGVKILIIIIALVSLFLWFLM